MPAAFAQDADSLCAACRQPDLACALLKMSTEFFGTCPAMGLRAACRQPVRIVRAACRQGMSTEFFERMLAACWQRARNVLGLSAARLAKLVLPWRGRSLQAGCAQRVRSLRAACAQHAGSVGSEASETCPAMACAQPARSMRAACRQPGLGFFQMSTEFFKPCQTPFLLKFPRTISSP